MANVKISDLPAATSIAGTETVPIVQDGVTKQATVQQLAGEVFQQATPAAQWVITHGRGRIPDVGVYLPSGERVITDVVASTATVTITFPAPTAGTAVLT